MTDKFDLPNMDHDFCLGMARSCAAFNLRKVTRLVSQHFDEHLAPTGLRITQLSLLVAAYLHKNLVMTKLAQAMGMDRTTLSRSLKVLEKRGLVELNQGEDRREVSARITKAGKEKLAQACPFWQKAQQQIVSGLHDGQWSMMISDLKDLAATIK